MKLEFLGAAGTVTGSRYLLSIGSKRLLIDCGLFQGLKALRLKNWAPLPSRLVEADAVLLTHAHIDHSGALPLLSRSGFKGKVFATEATRDLCMIMLPDSAHLQEDDARHANAHRYSKHATALPLYTLEDAQRVLTQFETVPFATEREIVPGVVATFTPAGHILGAASITIRAEGKTIVFSGDLGRQNDPLVKPPITPTQADYVVIESTYGDRRHANVSSADELARVVGDTIGRGGVLLIPAFAVGRAQLLLHLLERLKAENRIPNAPVFLNSPMASAVLKVFTAHIGEHRLSRRACEEMCGVANIVESVDESKALNERKGAMIIIAGSGMATGGRIVHHLKQFGPNPKNTILLAGFQAAGTRGARLVAGADELTIFGEPVQIKAEVRQMNQLSAHADCDELLSWLGAIRAKPKGIFITHGEPQASDGLRHLIEHKLKWPCTIPSEGEVLELVHQTT